MVAASAVSMAAVGSAKADAPDIGTVGSTTVLTALSTGTITITFLFSRAEFTNYLVLFNSTAAGVVTDGAVAGYPNPLITVVGAAPAAGVGVPLTINIDVVAGRSCSSGSAPPARSTQGGDPNSGCLAPNTLAFYGPAAFNNLDGNRTLSSPTRPRGAAAGLSGCLVEVPSCFLAAAGTTVVGFEDIAGQGLGDADFNDLVFSFTNVTTISEPGTAQSPRPEPGRPLRRRSGSSSLGQAEPVVSSWIPIGRRTGGEIFSPPVFVSAEQSSGWM